MADEMSADLARCLTCGAELYRLNMSGTWVHPEPPADVHDPAPAVETDRTELVPGRRYEVEIDDCCVQLTLAGTFEDFTEFPAEEGGGVDGYRFDFGVLEPAWGAFTFREVLS